MLWFVIRFAIWSGLLFGLISFEGISPLYFLHTLQTDATIYITDVWIHYFQVPVQLVDNTVVFQHGLKLMILNACNGLTPFILYLAAILAYPTLYKQKFSWFLGGMIILLTLNMLRIMFITIYVTHVPDGFNCAHNIVGRYSIGISALLVFYYFTTRVSVCVPYGIFFNGNNCHPLPALKH